MDILSEYFLWPQSVTPQPCYIPSIFFWKKWAAKTEQCFCLFWRPILELTACTNLPSSLWIYEVKWTFLTHWTWAGKDTNFQYLGKPFPNDLCNFCTICTEKPHSHPNLVTREGLGSTFIPSLPASPDIFWYKTTRVRQDVLEQTKILIYPKTSIVMMEFKGQDPCETRWAVSYPNQELGRVREHSLEEVMPELGSEGTEGSGMNMW